MTDEIKGQTLSTPDPAFTSEALIAGAVTAVANIYILFGSNLDNARQTALAGTLTALWLLGSFAHAAYIRGKRASGGGLISFTALPVAEHSDSGDVPAPRR